MISLTTNLAVEAIQLFQETCALIDDYIKQSGDDNPSSLPVSQEYKQRVFQFIDKVNLGLMEDKDNFYGYFLFQMEKEIRFDISSPTAVNFRGARYVIYFNPVIFLPLDIAQMESSIKHEILHVVSLHLLRAKDLRDNYSKLALNLAMDIVVNTYLQPLPPDASSLDRVKIQYSVYLPPFETLEYYAEEIQKALDARAKNQELSSIEESLPDPDQIRTDFDPMTTHDIWEESDEIDDQTLTKFTEKFVANADKGEVSYYLKSMIAALKDSKNELPWHWYLKKLVGSVTSEHKKTTTRRNRRQPERLDLPGRLRNYKAKLFIALDISGSISDSEFTQAMKEVLQIVRCYKHEITIIECDNVIRRTYSVESMQDVQDRPTVRGGTAFSPVIEFANSQKIDLLVYFTDGKGEDRLQVIPKGYKILWIISGQGDELSLQESYGVVKKLNPLKSPDTILDSYDVEKGGYSMNKQEEMSLDMD